MSQPLDARERATEQTTGHPTATIDAEVALAELAEAQGDAMDDLGIKNGLQQIEGGETSEPVHEAQEAERPVSYELFKKSLLDENSIPEMLRAKMTAPGQLHSKMTDAIQHYELEIANLEQEIAAQDLTDEEKADMWESATELASAAMLDELVGMINEELDDEERRELVDYLESVGVHDVFYIVNFSRNDSYIEDHPESLEAAPVHMDPVHQGEAAATTAEPTEALPVTASAASEEHAEATTEITSSGNEFTIEEMEDLFLKRGAGVNSTERAIKLVLLGKDHFNTKSTGLDVRLKGTQQIQIDILATALNAVPSFKRAEEMPDGREKVRRFSELLTQKHLRDRLARTIPDIRATK